LVSDLLLWRGSREGESQPGEKVPNTRPTVRNTGSRRSNWEQPMAGGNTPSLLRSGRTQLLPKGWLKNV